MQPFIGIKVAFVVSFISSVIIFKLLSLLLPIFIDCFNLVVGFIVIFVLQAWFSFRFIKRMFLNQRIQVKGKAVFITGCDRGFGYLLAKHLDSIGFKVFAGCLFPAGTGAKELNTFCSNRLSTLELDVTKDESVRKAFEYVKENLDGSELWAIVNNAGIRKGTGVEITSLDDFKVCMEINCLGVIRVTKAFLSLIKKSRGRIVNLTSISGRIAFPRNIAYVASKFAAVGFNDSLRREFDVWGIRVISIEPDIFQTPMLKMEDFDKMMDDTVKSLDPEIIEDYGEEYFNAIKTRTRELHTTASTNLNLVVDDLESAICLQNPDSIYRPSDSFSNKLFINIYLALPSYLQNELMRTVNLQFPKPRRVQGLRYDI